MNASKDYYCFSLLNIDGIVCMRTESLVNWNSVAFLPLPAFPVVLSSYDMSVILLINWHFKRNSLHSWLTALGYENIEFINNLQNSCQYINLLFWMSSARTGDGLIEPNEPNWTSLANQLFRFNRITETCISIMDHICNQLFYWIIRSSLLFCHLIYDSIRKWIAIYFIYKYK